jgi:hypothetical protein
MRFHDLRHVTATLLLRASVDPHRVQRILRHASVNTTLNTHLDVEDLREAVNRLPAGPVVPAIEPLRAVQNAPHGAPVVRNSESSNDSARQRVKSSSVAGPLPDDPAGIRTRSSVMPNLLQDAPLRRIT